MPFTGRLGTPDSQLGNIVPGGLAETSGALAGSSAGASSASASLSRSVPLAGASAGASTATGDLTVSGGEVALAGSSAGSSTASAGLSLSVSLAGASSGTSTAAGDLSVPTGGAAAGVSTAFLGRDGLGDFGLGNATVLATSGLAGSSAGVATAVGSLTLARGLVGSSAGVGTASGGLILDLALRGSSAGQTSTDVRLVVTDLEPAPGVAVLSGLTAPPVIRIDGVDITGHVEIAECEFKAAVNGSIGTARVVIKDTARALVFHTGRELTLDVEGRRLWGGFITRIPRRYYYEGSQTPQTPRRIVLECLDYNLLLRKRYLFDPASPTTMQLETFPSGTDDDVIIKHYLTNLVDLSGDGLDALSRIEHVGTPSVDSEISGAAGWNLGQFFAFISRDIGSIFYISPDKEIVYTDVDTPSIDLVLTDNPAVSGGGGGGGGGGGTVYEDRFNRTTSGIGDARYTLTNPGDTTHHRCNGSAFEIDADWFAQFTWNHGLTDGQIADASYSFDMWVPATLNNNAEMEVRAVQAGGSAGVDIRFYRAFGSTYRVDANHISHDFTPSASTWYRVKVVYLHPGFIGLKVWPRDDPEPGSYQAEDNTSSGTGSSNQVNFAAPFDELGLYDNLIVESDVEGEGGGEPTPTNERGVRELEIDRNADRMVNDMMVWGAGQGSSQVAFKRVTDTSAVNTHGLWQGGLFSPSIWRQSTVDRIASSWVYGSPQSKRGGKDDRVAVRCALFTPELRVGEKVTVRSDVFGYEDVLPIREMRLTFPSGVPRFDLVLSHEIDLPWSTFEFWFPEIIYPEPEFEGPEIPELEFPFDPCACIGGTADGSCVDTFTRVVSGGWGTSEIDGGSPPTVRPWLASGTMAFSVDGSKAIIAEPGSVSSGRIEFDSAFSLPLELLFDSSVRGVAADIGGGAGQLSVSTEQTVSESTFGTDTLRVTVHTAREDSNVPTGHVIIASARRDSDVPGTVETVIGTLLVTPGTSYTINIKTRLRIDATGACFVKQWLSGDSEPAWVSLGGDLEAIVGGAFTLRSSTGNQWTIDNFQVVEGLQCLCSKVGEAMGLFGGGGGPCAIETFSRTVSPGWGVSELNGASWSSNLKFSVDGGEGEIDLLAPHAFATAWLPIDLGPTNEFTWDQVWDRVPSSPQSGALVSGGFIVGPSSLHTEGFAVALVLGKNGVVSGFVRGNGQTVIPFSCPNVGPYSGGQVVHARARMDGSTISAKAWSGLSEPPDWDVTTAQTSFLPSFLGAQGQFNTTGTGAIVSFDNLEFVEGCSSGPGTDPCEDPETAPEPDPPRGEVCEELVADSAPPGHDPADSYFRARTTFVPGTTKVHLDGVFLRPGVDYAEGDAYYGGYIQIDSTIDVTGKVVYMCYRADPEQGNVVP